MSNIILSTLAATALLFSSSSFAVGGNESQIYQCTATCDPLAEGPAAPIGLFGNPSLLTPEQVVELSKAGASDPPSITEVIPVNVSEVKDLIANYDGNKESLTGTELTGTTGFDFEAECNAYAERFWEWRVHKCMEMDPEWKSPGLGKYLPNN